MCLRGWRPGRGAGGLSCSGLWLTARQCGWPFTGISAQAGTKNVTENTNLSHALTTSIGRIPCRWSLTFCFGRGLSSDGDSSFLDVYFSLDLPPPEFS